jgi:hypothetical protein
MAKLPVYSVSHLLTGPPSGWPGSENMYNLLSLPENLQEGKMDVLEDIDIKIYGFFLNFSA